MKHVLEHVDPSAPPVKATELDLLDGALRRLPLGAMAPLARASVFVLGPADHAMTRAVLAEGEGRGWTMRSVALPADETAVDGDAASALATMPREDGGTTWGVIDLRGLSTAFDWADGSARDLHRRFAEDLRALRFAERLLRRADEASRPFYVAAGREDAPECAFLPAMAQCLAQERTDLAVCPVLCGPDGEPGRLATALLDLAGLDGDGRFEARVHLRDGSTHVRFWTDREGGVADRGAAGEEGREGGGSEAEEEGILLVFGGTRGIAPPMVARLCEDRPWRIVVTGRRPLEAPAFDDGDLDGAEELRNRLRRENPEVSVREIRRRVEGALQARERRRALESLGALRPVEYRVCDCGNEEAVAALLDELEEEGPIRGILLAAGVSWDKSVRAHHEEDLPPVTGPKIVPLAVMARRRWRRAPAFLAAFSSLAAVTGNLRQCSYAGANAVLERLVLDRRVLPMGPATRRIVLSYAAWSGGMVGAGLEGILASLGIPCIPIALGASTLRDALAETEGDVHRLVLPRAAFFRERLHRHRELFRRLERLEAPGEGNRVLHVDRRRCRVLAELDAPSRRRLADHCLCECAPLLPASMVLARVEGVARRLAGATGAVEFVLHRAMRFFSCPDPLPPLAIDLEVEDDVFSYRVGSDGGGRCEGRLRFRDEGGDPPAMPPSVALLATDVPPERFYGGGGNELGPAYRILGPIEALHADGIQTRVVLPEGFPPLEGLLELVTQTNSTYCLHHHGAVSYPYRYEGFVVGDLPGTGTELALRMRRRLPRDGGALCAMDVELRDGAGRLVAWGGPMTNSTMAFGQRLDPGHGHCRFMDVEGMKRVDAFLGQEGLGLDVAYLASEKERNHVAALPEEARAAHMAGKAALVHQARARGLGPSVASFELESRVDGPDMSCLWPDLPAFGRSDRTLHLACCPGGGIAWICPAHAVEAVDLRPLARGGGPSSGGTIHEGELVLGQAWAGALACAIDRLCPGGPVGDWELVMHHGDRASWSARGGRVHGDALRIRSLSGSFLFTWRAGTP